MKTYVLGLAISSVTIFILSKQETLRWKGCMDGCFWTTVPSGTCAQAGCSRLSQRQHGVGCQNHVAVIALLYCGRPHSQIFKLLKPLKIS